MSFRNGMAVCDMVTGCPEPVTHIDHKGFIYCRAHGIQRKTYQRCRQLAPRELVEVRAGRALRHYNRQESLAALAAAKFHIRDWAGNLLFDGQKFDTFEDGWEFLYERFPDAEDLGEYYVLPVED